MDRSHHPLPASLCVGKGHLASLYYLEAGWAAWVRAELLYVRSLDKVDIERSPCRSSRHDWHHH
eukprot:5554900-Amphidinium_carterae.1